MGLCLGVAVEPPPQVEPAKSQVPVVRRRGRHEIKRRRITGYEGTWRRMLAGRTTASSVLTTTGSMRSSHATLTRHSIRECPVTKGQKPRAKDTGNLYTAYCTRHAVHVSCWMSTRHRSSGIICSDISSVWIYESREGARSESDQCLALNVLEHKRTGGHRDRLPRRPAVRHKRRAVTKMARHLVHAGAARSVEGERGSR